MIDFNKITETVINNFYGGEGEYVARMFVDENNKIMKGKLAKDCSIGKHCHETSCEVIFILSGKGKVILDGKEEILTEGDCHYCKKGQTHTLINIGEEDLIFYAVVPQQ